MAVISYAQPYNTSIKIRKQLVLIAYIALIIYSYIRSSAKVKPLTKRR